MKRILKDWWGAVFFVFVILLALLVGITKSAHGERTQLTKPSATLSCFNALDAVRESMFRSSMGEALLAQQSGDNDGFKLYRARAHTVMHTDDLKPSPKVCTDGNLIGLRSMAAEWEYEYLLDQAVLFKWENQ